MEYKDLVRDVLSDQKKRSFIVKNLRNSMVTLGFSEGLLSDFLDNIDHLDLEALIKKHHAEFTEVQLKHYFDEVVPEHFKKYVLPEIPQTGKIMDLGCGRGTLFQTLVREGYKNEMIGIDIIHTHEWDNLYNEQMRFEVVQEPDFLDFIKKEQPDHVTLTWVLHHMEFTQQKRYLTSLYGILREGATIVALEDSYADTIPPETGEDSWGEFKKWSTDDRFKIMGAYDWLANRVLSMRTTMPVPFAYRTLEDWKKVFEDVGFSVTKTRFLGFPQECDVNTARSIIVAIK
jgi:SAM-dependent methyltransferase